MARFDVFRGGDGDVLFLDAQADILSDLRSRVVIPLLPSRRVTKPMARLNPVFLIEEERMVLMPQLMAAIPASELREFVASLTGSHDEIVNAIDMLFQGF